MFEGQFIGWQDQCGEDIHCGDRVVLKIEEVAEWVECVPRYETIYLDGVVLYDLNNCAFMVKTDISNEEFGPWWRFGEFDQSEIQVTR